MEFDFLFIITCSLLLVMLIASFIIAHGMNSIENNNLTDMREPLIEFSADIKFNPFPQVVNITNEHKCTPNVLRKCSVNDQTSCIGCQSLIASCVHISEDIKYVDAMGNTEIIPKNENVNEGYCLTISSIEKRCSLYHGELTLVQLNPDSLDTMLVCMCTNPGYIGNESLAGACETPFICDGNVVDINKPLDEIKCVCTDNRINEVINDVPTCRIRTLLEADEQKIINNIVRFDNVLLTAPRSDFAKTIEQNTSIDKLINPCRVCPITGVTMTTNTIYHDEDADTKYCITTSQSNIGIPINRSKNERILHGTYGPDAVLALEWDEILIYTQLNDSTQELIYIISHNVNNDIFYSKYNFDKTKSIAISIGKNTHVGLYSTIPLIQLFPHAFCIPKWNFPLQYECQYVNTNRSYSDNLQINDNRFNRFVRFNKSREPPSIYFWGTDVWTNMNKFAEWIKTKEYTLEDGKKVKYATYNENFYNNSLDLVEKVAMVCWRIKYDKTTNQFSAGLVSSTNINDHISVRNNLANPN